MVHFYENGVELTQPFPSTAHNQLNRLYYKLWLVFDEPLYLGQMALEKEPTREAHLVESGIELVILLWRDEVEEVLADLIINRVIFQHEKIGFPRVGLSSHHFAEFPKRFCTLII